MPNRPHVLVIGASGRFLAQSAILAGCQVSVIDLFGDVDTQQFCTASNRFSSHENSISWARRIDALGDLSSPSSLGKGSADQILEVVEPKMDSPAFTIVFSGGAENYPEFFGRGFWGASEVAGPSESSIARLLDWSIIKGICQQHQIQTPRSIHAADKAVDVSTTWLQKRVRSGGGLQIQPWTGSCSVEFGDGYYLQERIKGTTLSGCFVSCHSQGRSATHLMGACQQLPNERPDDFRYHGSLGPVDLDERDYLEMERVGRTIGSELCLKGVWGIDFISTAKALYLVDINPRVTASAELIERYYRSNQLDFTILGAHLEATKQGPMPTLLRQFGDRVFSKTIVYLESEVPLIVNKALADYFQNCGTITDIPALGTEIQPGHPLVSVHSEAPERQALELHAAQQIKEVQALVDSITIAS